VLKLANQALVSLLAAYRAFVKAVMGDTVLVGKRGVSQVVEGGIEGGNELREE
jgi:hypothetical protein